MLLIAAVDWRHYMFMIPLTLLSVFLILVILVQRGRGGGLTGALGGMGGQSAFGTKAGDLFTRITIVVAAIWVLLSMASIKVLSHYTATANLDTSQRGQAAPVEKSGGLLPSATKSADGATGKSADGAEAPPSTTPPSAAPTTGGASAETPSATTPAATSGSSSAPAAEKSDAGAKPADAAKP
jgi:preprotein translocase subunit SecG